MTYIELAIVLVGSIVKENSFKDKLQPVKMFSRFRWYSDNILTISALSSIGNINWEAILFLTSSVKQLIE